MSTLTANGPAGTAHNPFAGSGAAVAGPVGFPADRYIDVGATPAEVEELTAYYDSLSAEEQRNAVAWHDGVGDDELQASLDRFREFRDAILVLGGLTEDERRALDGLTSEEKIDLARLAEESRADLADLSEEDRAALADLSDEDRAALATLTPEQVDALRASVEQPPVETPDATTPPATPPVEIPPGPVVEPAPETSTEQQPDETTRFTTKDVADLNMNEVEALVAKGDVTAADAIAAEQARGEKARPRLIERLNALLPISGGGD